MPLIGTPFAQGQTVPEVLEAVVYGRQQITGFHSPKQIYLAPLQGMCLILCGQKVHRQIICRVCLPRLDLMRNAMNCGVCLFNPLQTMTQGHFLETLRRTWPEPINLDSI